MNDRTLTDADVEAVADALEKRLVEKFYADLGRGVWGYVRRALFVMVLAAVAYGSYHGIKP